MRNASTQFACEKDRFLELLYSVTGNEVGTPVQFTDLELGKKVGKKPRQIQRYLRVLRTEGRLKTTCRRCWLGTGWSIVRTIHLP